MGDTSIQWTGKTWNPLRARNKQTGEVGWFCEHVSEGCRNCYAEKMNVNTYFGNGVEYKPGNLDHLELFLDQKVLEQPLRWRKPTMVFPCSMTDLFGRWVKDEWLLRIVDVMRRCPRHTFQVLTKRPEQMRDFCQRLRFDGAGAGRMWLAADAEASEGGYRLMGGNGATGMPWVWPGVSIEDQETADVRIPQLLQTPAAVRWISAEPLLGPVDLTWVRFMKDTRQSVLTPTYMGLPTKQAARVDWVVVGGESGPGARGFDVSWARSIVRQCQSANVPVFVKQLGAHPFERRAAEGPQGVRAALANIEKPHPQRTWFGDGWTLISKGELSEWIKGYKLKDKKGGNIEEWPEDLRVREFPKAA